MNPGPFAKKYILNILEIFEKASFRQKILIPIRHVTKEQCLREEIPCPKTELKVLRQTV